MCVCVCVCVCVWRKRERERERVECTPPYTQGITLALVKAMQSYDPLMKTSHPKVGYVKQLMESKFITHRRLVL